MRKKAQRYGRDTEWKNLQLYAIRVLSFYSSSEMPVPHQPIS